MNEKRARVMLFLSDQLDFKPVNVVRVQPKLQKQVMLQIQLFYHVTDSPGARGQAVRAGSRNDSRVIKKLRPPASLVRHHWERCSSGFCLFVCLFLVHKARSPTCPCLSQQRDCSHFLSSVGDKLLHFCSQLISYKLGTWIQLVAKEARKGTLARRLCGIWFHGTGRHMIIKLNALVKIPSTYVRQI